jgi:hypothetical protein
MERLCQLTNMTLCWSCKVGGGRLDLRKEEKKGGGDCLRRKKGCLVVKGVWIREGIINILNIK